MTKNIYEAPDVVKKHNESNLGVFNSGNDLNIYPYFKYYGKAIKTVLNKENLYYSDKPLSVLDVGCGAGWFGVYLERENLINDVSYSGIDESKEMCNYAKVNFPSGI